MDSIDQYFMIISEIFMKFSSIVSFGVSLWNCDGFHDFSPVMSPGKGKSRRGDGYHVYPSPLFDLPLLSVMDLDLKCEER